MTTSPRTVLSGSVATPSRLQLRARHRRLALHGVFGLALALGLAGCGEDASDASGTTQAAPAAEPVSVAGMQRFPSPPDSRSLGAMDEPEASFALPLGAADADAGVPVRQVEGRVFRRVSAVSTGARFDTLLEHYRGLIAEGGYEVLFACEGVEACGGPRFVGEVIEGYVTALANVSRARTVIALTDPTSGELGHFSLTRGQGDVAEYVGITVVRSERGPLTVVTQHGFVVHDD